MSNMLNNDAVEKSVHLDKKKLHCDLEPGENQHNLVTEDLTKKYSMDHEKVNLDICKADNGLSQIKTKYSIESENGEVLEFEDLFNNNGNNFINSSLKQIINAYSSSNTDNLDSAININLEHSSTKDHGREQPSDKDADNAQTEKYQTIVGNIDDRKSCITNTIRGVDEIHNDLTSCLDGTLENISLMNSELISDLEHNLLKDHRSEQSDKNTDNEEPETQKHQNNEDNIGNGNSCVINANRGISTLHKNLRSSHDTTFNFTKLKKRIHNLDKYKYRSKDSSTEKKGARSLLDKCKSADCSKLRNEIPNLNKYISKNCGRLRESMHSLYGKEFHHSYEHTSQLSTADANTVRGVDEIHNDSSLCIDGSLKNIRLTKSEQISDLDHSSYIPQIPAEENTRNLIKDTMKKQTTADKSRGLTVSNRELESFKKLNKEIQKKNTQILIKDTVKKQTTGDKSRGLTVSNRELESFKKLNKEIQEENTQILIKDTVKNQTTEGKSTGLTVCNRRPESFKKLNDAIQKKNVIKHADTQSKIKGSKNGSEIVKNLKLNSSAEGHESMKKKSKEHEREKRGNKDTNNTEVQTQTHQNIKDNNNNGNNFVINVTRVVNEIHNGVRPYLDTTLDSTKLKIRKHSLGRNKYREKDYDEHEIRTCSESYSSSKNYTHLKKNTSSSLYEREARFHNYNSELLDYYVHRRKTLKEIRKELHKRKKRLYKKISKLRECNSEHDFISDSTNSLQTSNIKERRFTLIDTYSNAGCHYNCAKYSSASTETCQVYLDKRHDIDVAYKKDAEKKRIQSLVSRQINIINNHISQNDNLIEPVQFSSTCLSTQEINFHTQTFEIKCEPEEAGNEKITVEAKEKVGINIDVELHLKSIPVVTMLDNDNNDELSVHTAQEYKRGANSINRIYTKSTVMQKSEEITMNCNDIVQKSCNNEFVYKKILVITIYDSDNDEEICGNSAEEYESRADSTDNIHAQNTFEQETQGYIQNNLPNAKYELSKSKTTYAAQIPPEESTHSLIKDTMGKRTIEDKGRGSAVYSRQIESLQKKNIIKHSASQSKIKNSKNDYQVSRNLKSSSSTDGDEQINKIKDSFIASNNHKKGTEENELNEENFNNEINVSLQESEGVANNNLLSSGKSKTAHIPQLPSEMKKQAIEDKSKSLAFHSRSLESFKKLNQEIKKKNVVKRQKSQSINNSKNDSDIARNLKSGTSTDGDEPINKIKDSFITLNIDKKYTKENELNKENFNNVEINAFMQESQEVANNDLPSSGKLKTTNMPQIPSEIKKRTTEEKNRGLAKIQVESFMELNQEMQKKNVLKCSDTQSKIKENASGSEVVRNLKSGRSADVDEPINKIKDSASAPNSDKKCREKNYLNEEKSNDSMQESQRVLNNDLPNSKNASDKSKSTYVPKIPLEEFKQSLVLNTGKEEKHRSIAANNRQLESFKKLNNEIQKIQKKKVLKHSESQSKVKNGKHVSEVVSNSKSGISAEDDESENIIQSSSVDPTVEVECTEKNDFSNSKSGTSAADNESVNRIESCSVDPNVEVEYTEKNNFSNSKSGTSAADDKSVNRTESFSIDPNVEAKYTEKNNFSERKCMAGINMASNLKCKNSTKNTFEQVITPYKLTKTKNAFNVQTISNKNDNIKGCNAKLQRSDITASSPISVLPMEKNEYNTEKEIGYFQTYRNGARQLPKETNKTEFSNSKSQTIIKDKKDIYNEALVNLPPEQKYRTDFIDWNRISEIVEESTAYAKTELANSDSNISGKLNTATNLPQIYSEKIKQSSANKKMNEQSTENICKNPFESLMTFIQKIQKKNMSKPCPAQSKINVRKGVSQVFRISKTGTSLDEDKLLNKIKEPSIVSTTAIKHTEINDLDKEKFKIDANTLEVLALNPECLKQKKKLSEQVIGSSKETKMKNQIDEHSILNKKDNTKDVNADFESSVIATSSSISILKIEKNRSNHEKTISYFQTQTFKVSHKTKEQKKVEFCNSNITRDVTDKTEQSSITERMKGWSNENERRLESFMTFNKRTQKKNDIKCLHALPKRNYDAEIVRNSKTETPVDNNKFLEKIKGSPFVSSLVKKHTEKNNLTQEKFKGEINTLNYLASNNDCLKRRNISKQVTRPSKVTKTKNHTDIYSILTKNNNECYNPKLQSNDVTSSSSTSFPTIENNKCNSEKERIFFQTLPSEVRHLPKEQNKTQLFYLNSMAIIKDKNDCYNEPIVDKSQENKYGPDSIDWIHINDLVEESEAYAGTESANSENASNKLKIAIIMPQIYTEKDNQSSALENVNKQSTDDIREKNQELLKTLNHKIQKKKNVCIPALSKKKDDIKVRNSKTDTPVDGGKLLDKIIHSPIVSSTAKQHAEKQNLSEEKIKNELNNLEDQTRNPECLKKRSKVSKPVTRASKLEKIKKHTHIHRSLGQNNSKCSSSKLQSSDITSSSSISTSMVESNRCNIEKEQNKTEINNSKNIAVTKDKIDIYEEPFINITPKHMYRDFNGRINVKNALKDESQALTKIELANPENVSGKLKTATCIPHTSTVEIKQRSTTDKINELCIEGKNGSKLEPFNTHKQKIQKMNMIKCSPNQSKIELTKDNFEVVKHSKAVTSVNDNESTKIKDASIPSNFVKKYTDKKDLNQENFKSVINTFEVALNPEYLKKRKNESELVTKLFKPTKAKNHNDIHSNVNDKYKTENSNVTLQSNDIVLSSSILPKEKNTCKSKTKTNYFQTQKTKDQNKNKFNDSNSITIVKNKNDIYNQPSVNITQKHKYKEDFIDKINAENRLMEESQALTTIELANPRNVSGKLKMANNTPNISPIENKQSSTTDKMNEQCIKGKNGNKLESFKAYKQETQKKSIIKYSPIQSNIKVNKYSSKAGTLVKDDESTKVKDSFISSNIVKKYTEKKDLNRGNFSEIHAFELALNPEYLTQRKNVYELDTKPFKSTKPKNHNDVHRIFNKNNNTKSSDATLQRNDIVSSTTILPKEKNRCENKKKINNSQTQTFGHQTKEQKKASFSKFDNKVTTEEKSSIYNDLFSDESQEKEYRANLSSRIHAKNALVQKVQAFSKTKLSTSENASGKLKTVSNISPIFSAETTQKSIPDRINEQCVKGKTESKLESITAHKQNTQKKKMIKSSITQLKINVNKDNFAIVRNSNACTSVNGDQPTNIKYSSIPLNIVKKYTEKKDLNQEKFRNETNALEYLASDSKYLKKRKHEPATTLSKSIKAKKHSDVHSIFNKNNNTKSSDATPQSNDIISSITILHKEKNRCENKKKSNNFQTHTFGHQTKEQNKAAFSKFDNRVTTEQKSSIYNYLFSDESQEEKYRANLSSRLQAKNALVQESQAFSKTKLSTSENALGKLKVATNTLQILSEESKQSLIAENTQFVEDKDRGQLESFKTLIQKTQKKYVTKCMSDKSKINYTKVDFEIVENSNNDFSMKSVELFDKSKNFSVATNIDKKCIGQEHFDEENYRGKVNTSEDVAPQPDCLKKRKKVSKKISRLSKMTKTPSLTDAHRTTHQTKKQDVIEFSHSDNKNVTKNKNNVYNESLVNIPQKEMCTTASTARENAENELMKGSQAFTKAELKNSTNISGKLKAGETKQSFTVWRMNKQSSDEESPVKLESFKTFYHKQKNNMIKCSPTQSKIKYSKDQVVKNSKAGTSIKSAKSLTKIKDSCIVSSIVKKNTVEKKLSEVNTSEDLASNSECYLKKRKNISGHITNLLKPPEIYNHADIYGILSQKDNTENCNATQQSSDVVPSSFTLPKENNRCKNENKINYFQTQIFGIKHQTKKQIKKSTNFDCSAKTKDKNNACKELLVIIPKEEKYRADCISRIQAENALRNEGEVFTNTELINSRNVSGRLKEKSYIQKISSKQSLMAESLKQSVKGKIRYKLESIKTSNQKIQKKNIRKCMSAQPQINNTQAEFEHDGNTNHGTLIDYEVALNKIQDASIVSNITNTEKNYVNEERFTGKIKTPENITSKFNCLKKRKRNTQVDFEADINSDPSTSIDNVVSLDKIKDFSIVSNITSIKKNYVNEERFTGGTTSKYGTYFDCEVVLNKIKDVSDSNINYTEKNYVNEERFTGQIKTPDKIMSKTSCLKKRKKGTQVDFEVDKNSDPGTSIDSVVSLNKIKDFSTASNITSIEKNYANEERFTGDTTSKCDILTNCEVVLNKIEDVSIYSNITNAERNYVNEERFTGEIKTPDKITSKSNCLKKRKRNTQVDFKADKNSDPVTSTDSVVSSNKIKDFSIASNITNIEKNYVNEERFTRDITSKSSCLRNRKEESMKFAGFSKLIEIKNPTDVKSTLKKKSNIERCNAILKGSLVATTCSISILRKELDRHSNENFQIQFRERHQMEEQKSNLEENVSCKVTTYIPQMVSTKKRLTENAMYKHTLQDESRSLFDYNRTKRSLSEKAMNKHTLQDESRSLPDYNRRLRSFNKSNHKTEQKK